jgi:hypothetical protein
VPRALHPCRRARAVRLFFRRIASRVMDARWRATAAVRRQRRGPIGCLSDQPCKFRKRIALAASLVGGGKGRS